MPGFFGWSNFSVARRPAAEVAREISSDSHSLDLVDGKEWALAVRNRQPNLATVYRTGEDFSVVLGDPIISDQRIAQLQGDIGIAEICHSLYKETGTSFLPSLSGSFSMAMSIDGGSRILLAVDKIGVRPLYYSLRSNGLAFASDLQHFSDCSELDLSIDPQSIYDYLHFHVIPSPGTIYKQVQALTPGTYLEVGRDARVIHNYWQIEYTNEQSRSDFSVLQTDFKNALRQCVSFELESSGTVGCFLSGGTDSSTLAGIITDVTGRPARTYSIGFDQQGFDEMEYARLAASHFGLEHHEYYVTPNDIVDLVPRIAGAYGQPFGNSSVIPTYYCARMAAADGIEKLLGGDGGDELFGGNERYARQILFSYYTRIPESLRTIFIEPSINKFPFGQRFPPIRKIRRYVEQARIPLPDRLQTYGYLQLIGDEVILERGFLDSVDVERPLQSLRGLYNGARATHLLNRMLALDLKLTLADNDLPKVSRMCELAGISTGYPFLGDPLVDFSASLPAHMKVHGLKIRYFFKAALSDYLPQKIINKQKHGFGLPFGDWLLLNNGLRSMAFDSLQSLKKREIVRSSFIDDLRDNKIAEHPSYYGGLVWVLMILQSWFEQNSSNSQASV